MPRLAMLLLYVDASIDSRLRFPGLRLSVDMLRGDGICGVPSSMTENGIRCSGQCEISTDSIALGADGAYQVPGWGFVEAGGLRM